MSMEELFAQHGPVLTLREHPGLSSALSRACIRGEATAILPGVYVPVALRSDPQVRLAAVHAWNPLAVVCGAAAARQSFWPDVPCPVVEVAAETRLRRAGFTFSRRIIPSELIVDRPDARFTGAALTAVDLIDHFGGEPIDRALRSRHVTVASLNEALEMTNHRRGHGERRNLVLASRAKPWAAGERVAHRLLDRHRITGWIANPPMRIRGATYYPDILFKKARTILEIDGYQYHSDPLAFEYDRRRRNDLTLAGYRVFNFTNTMLDDDADAVVDTVQRALRMP